MSSSLKRWTGLGLSAALAGGTLAACGNPAPATSQPEAEISAPTPPIETPEPEAAEAGEGEGGVVFAASAIDAAARVVARLLADQPDGITVAEARDAWGTSRKFAIPLITRLDETGVTRRRGDLRIAGPRLPAV